ncbi:MAG TPA: RagB/SusD family nutrient uptake outer membrane protein [Longimicrobiales bacterium]|nr:RagB/SusD family nutrient uptake outer membrane protein [Longimicrobiales bacterium]
MRHTKVLTLALLLPVAAGSTACSDFLGLEPHQSVSDAIYFQTVDDFRAAIVGVYDAMQSNAWYGRSMYIMSDIMGEDIKKNSTANRYKEFADFEGQVISGHMYERELWAAVYQGIDRLNRMINAEFTPPASQQAEYNQIIGEAYALRGLAYFDLARMYAQHYTFTADAGHPGVPIVLASDITARPGRSTVAEVYGQAVADLTAGLGRMTTDRHPPFMMSRSGAQAILSRIYLYMEDWGRAVAMADSVIGSNKYTLATGATYVSQFSIGASPEAIFELEYNSADRQGNEGIGGMYRASGYGDYLPSKDLLNLIPPGDVRNDVFVVDPLLTGIYASMRVNKWPLAPGDDNIPVIRLSEVYLNRAEANARLGNTAAAQADLDLIRKRGLATAPDVTATGQALLDEILIERRIELVGEGHRIHDLMRHKQDIVRVDNTSTRASMSYPCNFCILPIPFEEVDVNPNITQNAGY